MKKWIAIAMIASLSTVITAGCSNEKKTTQGDTPTTTNTPKATDSGKEKITINSMAGSFKGGGWPDNNHPIIQHINEKFNVDFNMQWVPGANYDEKLNVMAASGQLPDLFVVNELEYLRWQSQGVFVELTPYLKQYPNLAKAIPQEMMEVLNPPGKLYGLGKFQPANQLSVVVRKDWLTKLNIPVPNPDTFTLDQFYEIAKAFAKNDPDGNGKADTVGFTASGSDPGISLLNGAQPLEIAFGLADLWKEENGKLIPRHVQTNELKQYLAFMRKAYEEGVLDRDFMTNSGTIVNDKIGGNQLGLAVAQHQLVERSVAQLKKIAPNAEIIQLPPPKAPSGLRGNPTRVGGTTKIVLNAKLDEKKRQRILSLLDWWATEEGTKIIKSGPEGIFYTKSADGKVELTERGKKEQDSVNILNNWFFRNSSMKYETREWDDQKKPEALVKFQTENAMYAAKADPSVGFTNLSATYMKKSTDLDAKFKEAMLKIIMGREPVESIEKAVEDWKKNGGDQIVKEVNEAYSANKSGK
ncbi:extracellular solute-binding protein [Paenibacillus qinlingensis]|uniref:ABC-type glycerol-3-phosphate transport system substrate-binding protein n=1 Tax=Paenibacillus qinlingensis TaxID=1837343 RepID=A0ABU1P2B0_9BACL|nr:extracellular solute-binding protein [Paenibacillus qinlingensis]MDR6553893.1 ABC-type glycerol-3-phosphate transport system substrate-binding protein [Paenibacillus qinlingensis]